MISFLSLAFPNRWQKNSELIFSKEKAPNPLITMDLELSYWRRHPDLNWGMKVLQTSALPLGYVAACSLTLRSAVSLTYSLSLVCLSLCITAYSFKNKPLHFLNWLG